MKSSGNHPITGKAAVEETVFGGQQTRVKGRDNNGLDSNPYTKTLRMQHKYTLVTKETVFLNFIELL